MVVLQDFLRKYIVLVPIVSCCIGMLHFKKYKHSNWKYLIYYLLLVSMFELISHFFLQGDENKGIRTLYFDLIVIPFEYIFFYWLYAINSFKNWKLFWFMSSTYLLVVLATYTLGVNKVDSISKIGYSVGSLLLAVLIVKEFLKQIKSDEILTYKENLMFYINIGAALFYIGTLPYWALKGYLIQELPEIKEVYWAIFLLLYYFMYFMISCAFIWGKPRT